MKQFHKIFFCFLLTSVLLFVVSLPAFANPAEVGEQTVDDVIEEREETYFSNDVLLMSGEASTYSVTEIDLLSIIASCVEEYISPNSEYIPFIDEDLLNIWDEIEDLNIKLDEQKNFQYVLVFSVGFLCGIKLLNCFSFWKW